MKIILLTLLLSFLYLTPSISNDDVAAQSAIYAKYLGACSKYKRSYNFKETSITEVEVFVGENLDISKFNAKKSLRLFITWLNAADSLRRI